MSEREDKSNDSPDSPPDGTPGGRDATPDPGIAGRIARQFIESPITILLMAAGLAIGLLGLFITPRQEDPQISVPMIDIFVGYPGASSEQVANLVTDPLERIMSEINNTKHVYSRTSKGRSMVTVRFEVGEEMEESVVRVHDKLQSNMDRIPPGVSKPLVKPVGINDVPILNLTLWSESVDDSSLRSLGHNVVQDLAEIPTTGDGFVVGGQKEQVRVQLNAEALKSYGLSPASVAQTIRTANSKSKAGSIENQGSSYTVYTGSFLHTARDVGNLLIDARGGGPVYVRDVAEVSRGPEETRRMVQFYSGPARADGKPLADGASAVTVAIAKKEGTNGVTVAESILNRVDQLKGSLIPDNVNVDVTRNYGKTANQKVNELLMALFQASLAVAFLCLIGLGLRAASVVITVIPITILVTIFFAYVLNFTIDRVSLFALVFSIGILVDDATVVVENIFRRWLEAGGETTTDIAVDAVREVGNPTVLANLTIIAALLPMGFVRGLMGPYMAPIPVLGSVAAIFSMLAGFVFVPWMARRVRPTLKTLERAEAKEKRLRERIARFYRPIVWPLMTRRTVAWGFLGTMVAGTVLSCSLFYFQAVPFKVLPYGNKPEYQVVINMPEGTALPVTANVTRRLAEKVRTVPEVRALQTYVGTASPFNFNGMVRHYYLREKPWQADILINLLNKNQRERSSHQIAVATRDKLTPIAARLGATIQVVEMPPGPPVRQTVVAEVYGNDAGVRRQVARDMTGMFEDVPNLVDVDNFLAAPHRELRFDVNKDKAKRNGLTQKTINKNVKLLFGKSLGDVKRGVALEPTNIHMEVPLARRSRLANLSNVPIANQSGKTTPLGEVGRFQYRWADPVIYHKDLQPVEYVTGEMEGKLGAPLYGMLDVEKRLADYTAPDGSSFSGMPWGLIQQPTDQRQPDIKWGGAWTVTYETFRDMGMAFMAALVLIYGLIVWQFKNYTLALVVMSPIPLTLLGVVPGHWLLGAKFTATSMIGFIALAGIIVRNSILLVSFAQNEVAAGRPVGEAVVAAGQNRMRPILITALTLMAGAAVLLTDPIFVGMAISLLFGAGVSTILTLIALPLGCLTAADSLGKTCGIPRENLPVEPEIEQAKTTSAGDGQRSALGWVAYGLMVVLAWIGMIIAGLFFALYEVAIWLIGLLRSRFGSSGGGPGGPSPGGGGGPTSGPQGGPDTTGGGHSGEVRPADEGDDVTKVEDEGAGSGSTEDTTAEADPKRDQDPPSSEGQTPEASESGGEATQPGEEGQADRDSTGKTGPSSDDSEAKHGGSAEKQKESEGGSGSKQSRSKRRGIRSNPDLGSNQ